MNHWTFFLGMKPSPPEKSTGEAGIGFQKPDHFFLSEMFFPSEYTHLTVIISRKRIHLFNRLTVHVS